MTTLWNDKELNFIEKYKELIETRKYSGILVMAEKESKDKDFGLKICLLVSMLSGDKIGITCLPDKGLSWGLIIQFVDRSFTTINEIPNGPVDYSTKVAWTKYFLEGYLTYQLGITHPSLIEKILQISDIV